MPRPDFGFRLRTLRPAMVFAAVTLVVSVRGVWSATVQDTSSRRDTVGAAKQSASKGRQGATTPARPKPVWPVNGPAPRPGSILPNKRIVAYYGNPLSK